MNGERHKHHGVPSSVAKRVRSELERLVSFDRNKPIYREWAKAWGVHSSDPQQPALAAPEVARRLNLLNQELDELESQLATQHPKLSASTTTNPIHRFRMIIAKSIESLGGPWGNVQPELTPDLLQCLQFWDDLLAATEFVPEGDELRDLLQSILDAQNAASQMADSELRSAVLAILAQLRNAIMDFQAGGPQAFRNAFREAVAETLKHQDVIRENADSDEIGALAKVWGKFQDVCAPLIFADALLTAGGRFKQLGETIWKLLGPGGP